MNKHDEIEKKVLELLRQLQMDESAYIYISTGTKDTTVSVGGDRQQLSDMILTVLEHGDMKDVILNAVINYLVDNHEEHNRFIYIMKKALNIPNKKYMN